MTKIISLLLRSISPIKKSIRRNVKPVTLTSLDEQAVFILKLLNQKKYTATQLFDAKRLVQKWQRHYPFKELVMDLSMSMNCGEDYFFMDFV